MKTDRYRLERIAEIGDQLLKVIDRKGITAETLETDLETQWLVTTPLFNIGEQANCLSAELTAEHDDIPWSQIAGLRHRLIHNYEGTNWSMISSVVFDELEALVVQIREIIASLPED